MKVDPLSGVAITLVRVEASSVSQNSPSRQLFIANTQSAGVEIPHWFGFICLGERHASIGRSN